MIITITFTAPELCYLFIGWWDCSWFCQHLNWYQNRYSERQFWIKSVQLFSKENREDKTRYLYSFVLWMGWL